MKLSTRLRYGLRALVDLAAYYGKDPQLIREIARRQEISQSYLEQIVIALRAAGLIKSVRGAKGGLMLARAPSSIPLAEVVDALEGSFALVECVDEPNTCNRAPDCATRGLWIELKNAMDGVFKGKTLQDLVCSQEFAAD
jgi:Rrf2 family protein